MSRLEPGDLASLVEIQLVPPVRVATAPDLVDENGDPYAHLMLGHPVITRALSQVTHGIATPGTLAMTIVTRAPGDEPSGPRDTWVANPITARFRGEDARGAVIVVREYVEGVDGPTIAEVYRGKIQQAPFTSGQQVQISAADTNTDDFGVLYPRILVTADRWPGIDAGEGFDRGATVPLHFGMHREHTPLRYVEGTERLYKHGTQLPRLFTTYRYLAGMALAKSVQGNAGIVPRVRTLYRGLQVGVVVIPPGEYTTAYNRKLVAPTLTSVTLQGGGTLTAGREVFYQLTALNGCGESLGSQLLSVTPNGATLSALVQWGQVMGAVGYCLSRAESFSQRLLTIVAGGEVTSFLDDGRFDRIATRYIPIVLGDTTYVPPLADLTGQGTLEVIFPRQQLGDNGLAPILGDFTALDYGWDQDVRGLYNFDGDPSDGKPHDRNFLHRKTALAVWTFPAYDRRLDCSGNLQRLQFSNGRPDDLVLVGAETRLKFNAPPPPADGTVPAASLLGSLVSGGGLDWSSAAGWMVEFKIKTDPGTLDRRMIVLEQFGAAALVRITIDHGCLSADIGPPAALVTVRGSTRLDGAMHRCRIAFDRVKQELAAYVDDLLEDSAPTPLVGAVNPNGQLFLGGSADGQHGLAAELAWIVVDADPSPVLQIAPDVRGIGERAVDFSHPSQKTLLVRNAAARGLAPAAAAGWTIEVEFLPTAKQAGTLVDMQQGQPSGYALGVTPGSGQAVRPNFKVSTDVAQYLCAGGSAPLGGYHTAAGVYVGRTPDTPGSVQLVVDGALVDAKVIPPGPLQAIPAPGDFLLGARTDVGDSPFAGYVTRVRVTARAKTLDALAEAHYLLRRNFVRQVRTVLESAAAGASMTLDSASWDQAERNLDLDTSGELVTDGALVEPTTLADFVAGRFRWRGGVARFLSSGALGCEIDRPSAEVASFGYFQKEVAPVIEAPVTSHTPLGRMVQKQRVQYRRRRVANGGVDRYLFHTSDRDVLASGLPEPDKIPSAELRDIVAADRGNAYLAAVRALTDRTVAFASRHRDTRLVGPGSRIRFFV